MNSNNKSALVAGAGGFIGGHMVAKLIEQNYSTIIAVDIKPIKETYQSLSDDHNEVLD